MCIKNYYLANSYRYAEKIAVPVEGLYKIPNGWSFREAAGLYVTAPTSYAALVERANLKADETCLVLAAAGGVGIMAVQIAKALGATVIAACSPTKAAIAKRYGADHYVNYNEKDWIDQVKKLTGGKGVNVVYDPIGRVEQSLRLVAWDARILVIGFAAGTIEKVAMNRVLLKNSQIIGLHWGAYKLNQPQTIPEVWNGIFKMVAEDKIKPTVYDEKEYKGLESVASALVALGNRDTWGKVIIDVDQSENSKL